MNSKYSIIFLTSLFYVSWASLTLDWGTKEVEIFSENYTTESIINYLSFPCENSNIDCSGNGLCQSNECVCFPDYMTLPNESQGCSYTKKNQTTSFLLTLFMGLFGAGIIYLCNWDWVMVQMSLFGSLISLSCISCWSGVCYVLCSKKDGNLNDPCVENTATWTKFLCTIIALSWSIIWIVESFKAGFNNMPDMCAPMINGTYIYPQPW